MSSLRPLIVVIALSALGSWAWRSHVASVDGEALRPHVRPGDIRMISSESCGWCVAARRWMTQQRIPFDECFVERDARCQEDYRALGAAGTPTLVVRGQRIIGFDRARLIEVLTQP